MLGLGRLAVSKCERLRAVLLRSAAITRTAALAAMARLWGLRNGAVLGLAALEGVL